MSHRDNQTTDHVELLCSVVELGSLFTETPSLNDFLQKVVETVAARLGTPVCSIYLYDDNRNELVLQATRGLTPNSPKEVKLKAGEGITGAALNKMEPIRESQASRNPNFKFFPGIEEEKYEAFIAVPILRSLRKIGVLTVQHEVPDFFTENDTAALRAIASQLAETIENTKLFLDLTENLNEQTKNETASSYQPGASFMIKGKPGSRGFSRGHVTYYGILSREESLMAAAGNSASASSIDDFRRSLRDTEKELEYLQKDLEKQALDLQASLIFNAHLLILKDPDFSGKIEEGINGGQAPPAAIVETVRHFATLFHNSDNSRLREKVQDINDLGHRLLLNLNPDRPEKTGDYHNRIVIARELLPSDILKIATQRAAGLIITSGSFTAHTAILARSLDVPLVIAKDERLFQLSEKETLLIDAARGTIYVNPDKTILEQYTQLEKVHKKALASEPAEDNKTETVLKTADGTRIKALANINLISEIAYARQLGAEGIGLYRSEFPYLVRNDFPQEEEQYRIYQQIISEMEYREITFRTLDIGGDKMLSYFPTVNVDNPFLGLRAIRFSLQYRKIFKQQLRALIRAGAESEGEARIMFPLISSLDDFLEVKKIVEECTQNLVQENTISSTFRPKLGIMVELPSAVETAPELAQNCDFFCLGSNDLIQYTLAADRTNPEIAHYYLDHHPAVLRLMNKTAVAARKENIPLSVCGETVENPLMIPFLLGIGIRDFSLNPHGLSSFRQIVRKIKLEEAEKLAAEVLRLGTVKEIESRLRTFSE